VLVTGEGGLCVCVHVCAVSADPLVGWGMLVTAGGLMSIW
jgi:hypothetical protein